MKLEFKDLVYGVGLLLSFLVSTMSSCIENRKLNLKAEELRLRSIVIERSINSTDDKIDNIVENIMEK